ncbi:Isochorismatase hydrolase [Desulfosarcina cetonica]|nr:Isochorismatase hydrolase [Desulfosarcina cetonica]
MTTMLQPTTTVLLLIDIQGKLAQLMHAKARLFDNLQKLVRGIRVLDIPVLWVEQNPAGLGPTIDEVATLLPDLEPIPKMSFSACGNENFVAALKDAARHQVLVAGIETHICVYQTAVDLIEMGYEAHVVADAVSSRTPENKNIGLEKMKAAGALPTSVETALFELLGVAQGEAFKAISKIVK